MLSIFFSATYLALFIQICVATLQDDLSNAGIQAYFTGSSEYNDGRLAFNRRYDINPAGIAYPTSPAQVASALVIGKKNGVRVSARSGGHSYIANGVGGTDGALVIDLSKLKSITVDTSTNQAVVQTGNRVGDIILALNTYGRAMPHGTCPFVGIGGHASYGGWGFTSRMWGLTLDNIVSADVVLVDGSIQTNSTTQNTELFWALRGAAPSFGIVTAWTFKVYTIPTATFFNYGWDLSSANTAQAILNIQTFAQTNIPGQLGFEMQFLSSSNQGNVYVSLTGGWYGVASQLSGILKPFLDTMPAPGSTTVNTQAWLDHLSAFSGGPLNLTGRADTANTFYAKSLTTPSNAPLSPASITALSNYMANQGFNPGSTWFVQMAAYGGPNSAITAVGADDTAYPWRQSLWNFQFYTSSNNYQPPFPSSGFTFLDNMVSTLISNNPTNWSYGGYANYADDRNPDWKRLYYGTHYTRLKTLKDQLDPSDVLNFAISVDP